MRGSEDKIERSDMVDPRSVGSIARAVGVVMVNLKGRRRTLGIAPEVSQES